MKKILKQQSEWAMDVGQRNERNDSWDPFGRYKCGSIVTDDIGDDDDKSINKCNRSDDSNVLLHVPRLLQDQSVSQGEV
ncbi:hypothetical protein KIN20_021025 [Parelaphostrongylus tenuis]|uniref:Uncharacterized protein n=1 Tax=Parelaphostrongylus tenuis TaxID=148309 RepID=A0AAD5MND1_PARTN|nr:hypothetical protein KIN20_021025 [Parelaphostrongylus tenuis]